MPGALRTRFKQNCGPGNRAMQAALRQRHFHRRPILPVRRRRSSRPQASRARSRVRAASTRAHSSCQSRVAFATRTMCRFVAKQPCLICGRQPSDAHHLRFAQLQALGRKVSDEFTVPLCRGHHREVHRCGDEGAWWKNAGIDAIGAARMLWTETHPLRPVAETQNPDMRAASTDSAPIRPRPNAARNRKTKPIVAAGAQ